ncbi:MAG: hypothetical protein K5776_00720 [Lachnospiraceae bacterium]|nr:hypothetical protein [Lachnospiraceae bacterium]
MKKATLTGIITLSLVGAILVITITLLIMFFVSLSSPVSPASNSPQTASSGNTGNLSTPSLGQALKNTASSLKNNHHNGIEMARIVKTGNHVYYPEQIFDKPEMGLTEKLDVERFLNHLDSSLTEDLYFYSYIYNKQTGDVKVFGMPFYQGALIEGFYGSAESGSSGFTHYSTDPLPDLSSLKLDGILDDTDVITTARALTNQNRLKLYYDETGSIYGLITLKYDPERDILYYDCVINEYSNIQIDAHTGDILLKSFFNGEYGD